MHFLQKFNHDVLNSNWSKEQVMYAAKLYDVIELAMHGRDREKQRDRPRRIKWARNYIQSREFDELCDLLNIEADYVRRKVNEYLNRIRKERHAAFRVVT